MDEIDCDDLLFLSIRLREVLLDSITAIHKQLTSGNKAYMLSRLTSSW